MVWAHKTWLYIYCSTDNTELILLIELFFEISVSLSIEIIT